MAPFLHHASGHDPGFLAERQERAKEHDLISAQESALKSVWDNPEDQAWDHV